MPVPLHIFGLYTIIVRKASDIIKADPVRMPFIEKASMAVDWNLHTFVGYITRSGSICYLDLWYMVRTVFPPSRFSHRILDAAGGSSQISKL